MAWETMLVQTSTFLAVSALTFLAFKGIWAADARVQDRLGTLANGPGHVGRARPGRSPRGTTPFRARIAAAASRLLSNDERERTQLQARLIQAGIYAPWAAGVFLTVKMLLITGPPLIGFTVGQCGLFNPYKGLFYGALAGSIGIIAPGVWLQNRKNRRHARLLRSLPDFLDLMVTCVQSGLSLDAALQRVTDELSLAHPLLAGEMSVVQRQIELGAAPDLALRNLAERSDLAALHSLSALVEQARRFGTSVTEALRTNAEMLRDQREQRAEEMGQKAAVKILFPTLLFIFPAIFVVLVGPAAVQIAERFSAEAPAKAPIESPHHAFQTVP
jgi:tight adherence protein C